MAVLKSAAGLSPRALIDEVNGQLKAFCAGAPQSDDITMVAVRVGK
jgi:serine phosphatase RsbU (regulator of sigma subunit)